MDKGSSPEYESVALLAHASHKAPQPKTWHRHPQTLLEGEKAQAVPAAQDRVNKSLKYFTFCCLELSKGFQACCGDNGPVLREAQHLKFAGLASSAYPAKDPAFPPEVNWKLLHTGSFLKYELSKIISIFLLLRSCDGSLRESCRPCDWNSTQKSSSDTWLC